MIDQLIYRYAQAILVNLRSQGQGKEAALFHQKIGTCLRHAWDNPVTANAEMLQIVNSRLSSHLQLNLPLDQPSTPSPHQTSTPSPRQLPKESQTKGAGTASHSPSTDAESPSPTSPPTTPRGNDTSVSANVASSPSSSPTKNDSRSDGDDEWVPDYDNDDVADEFFVPDNFYDRDNEETILPDLIERDQDSDVSDDESEDQPAPAPKKRIRRRRGATGIKRKILREIVSQSYQCILSNKAYIGKSLKHDGGKPAMIKPGSQEEQIIVKYKEEGCSFRVTTEFVNNNRLQRVIKIEVSVSAVRNHFRSMQKIITPIEKRAQGNSDATSVWAQA